jgi:chaperonin cofactor prefoldin
MTTATSSDRTRAAIQARRTNVDVMLNRVRDALKQMRREHARVSIAAIARRADVSRTFLYQNVDARSLVAAAAAAAGDQRMLDQAEQAAHVEASWRERALNAEDALKTAHTEIITQRGVIGQLLGKIRDLENDLPEDGIQRTLTENTSLKQQIRQLTQDKGRLEERLKGARDNNRFLDKRVADLEAELVPEFDPHAPEQDDLSPAEPAPPHIGHRHKPPGQIHC